MSLAGGELGGSGRRVVNQEISDLFELAGLRHIKNVIAAVTVGLGSRNSSDAAGTRLLLLAAERAGMRFQRQESTEFRTPHSITLS